MADVQPNTDTVMAGIPQSVAEQGAEADRLLAEMQQAEPPQGDDGKTQTAPETRDKPQQPIDDKLDERYRTLKGKYDAEVPRLYQAMRERDAQIAALTAEISRIAAQNNTSAPTTTTQDQQHKRIDPERFNDWGDEFKDLARENNAMAEKVSTLEATLAELKGDTTATREERFYADLQKSVPSFTQLNEDRGFIDWLAQPHPYLGIPRQALLDQAAAKFDAKKAAAIFNEYLSGQSHSRPNPTVRKDLKSQVSPTSRAPTQSDIAPTGRIFSQAEVSKLYDDERRGLFAGREAEFAAQEKEIFAAQREGRIR